MSHSSAESRSESKKPSPPLSKQMLNPARRRLLEWLRRIYFGRLEGLTIRNGEPQFDPPPKIVREHKFGGENGPRSEQGDDFLLKQKVVELFAYFDEHRDFLIDVLEVQHGLPFRMTLTESRS